MEAGAGEASLGCASAPHNFPLRGEPPELTLRPEDAGWLEVIEAGQSVAVARAGDGDVMTIPQPLRYGWHWLEAGKGSEVTIRYRDAGQRARGSVDAILHCERTPQLSARLTWLKHAAQIGRDLETPVNLERLAARLDAIGALEADASDAVQRATARHYRAQALGANNRSEEASRAFEEAETLWAAVHDDRRALAAHLGWIEELQAIDAHDKVLALTPDVSSLHGAQTYFSTRLLNSRCLSLQTVGRLGEAEACFRWMLDSYQTLDERAEYVVAAQSLAGLLRDRGNLDEAEKIGVSSLPMAGGPIAAQVRGRLRLMLADIALRRGAVPQALTHFDQALREFDQPLPGSKRWIVNAYLMIAIMYEELGALDESYSALARAIAQLTTIDAPSRMALAMLVYADLEIDAGHVESALWWRRVAEETYSGVGATPSADAARAMRLLEQLDAGDAAGIAAALAGHVPGQPRVELRWQLLAAAFALTQNRLPEAQAAVSALRQFRLPLREQTRLAAFEAGFWLRSGDSARSLQVLFESAKAIGALAAGAGNLTVRYAVQRQQIPLRQQAFEQLLDSPRGVRLPADRIESLFAWLALQQDYASNARGASASDTAFAQAVATELLAPAASVKAAAESTAQRQLLSILAQRGNETAAKAEPSASGAPTLAGVQQALAPDAALVAYLDGGARGALLWITRDAANVFAAAAPDEVRNAQLALRDLLRSPASPVAAIDAAQRRLSKALFGHAPPAPPQRLYVLGDDATDGVAWAALRWPGQAEPVIASTAVSIVQFDPLAAAPTPHPASVKVIVAEQRGGNDASLPRLAAAGVEARQMAPVLAGHDMRVEEDAVATRASVLAALAQPGGWVHIAAHGVAQPQRIGYAGIWLEPAAGDSTPPFLSWLDVLDVGARADLVVLNACRLGDGGNVVGANFSFATAVARAGARHVVAAQWPVSDAASALWVPVFYAALVEDRGNDPARALRAAQLRLRDSREFRHPYFWAGLQTIERLPVAAAAPAAR